MLYLKMMNFLKEMCRICLNETDLLKLFQDDIYLSLIDFASIDVKENDGLPENICVNCKNKLEDCIQFRELCKKTDARLKKELNDNIKKEEPQLNEIKSENILNKCAHCNRTFTHKKSLSLHLTKMHAGKEQLCEICNTSLKNKYSLIMHLKKKHFIDKKKYKKSLQCHICGKIFNYQAELLRHLCSHTGLRQFKCNECEKAYISKSALAKHMLKHTNIRKYECVLCPKKFIHPSNLQVHKKVHLGEKKYLCNICNKRFKTNRNLTLHLRIHSNQRDYPCALCDKAFTNKYDLLRHNNRHERKRLIEEGVYDRTKEELNKMKNSRQCDQCGKICSGPSDLKKHLRVHTNERPYKCSYCDKSFKTTSTLHTHEKVHTKERPYVCNYCGKGFTQSSNLKTHERLHSGIKPFCCTICNNKAFNRKRDLDNHIQKHNNQEKDVL